MTERPGGDPTPLRIPEPALRLEARAERFRRLAEGHAARDWLLLLSRIAAGQRAALREIPVAPLRAPGDGPPLDPGRLPRDDTWRRMLAVVVGAARAPGLPAETRAALDRLAAAGPEELEGLADAVLRGEVPEGALAVAPFVGAALQAWFGALAATLDPAAIPARAPDGCPACGSPPVAGIVQGDRLRYLSCTLCGAEWYVPRVQCASCSGDGALAYFNVEGDPGAKAEACGACRAYVKLFDEERRPGAEAAADDAATLALDLLMAQDGWRRGGVNLYLAR